MNNPRLVARLGVSLAALCIATTAHAQDQGGEEEIIVTGQRAQLERSIEIKRDALGVVDVAAADEIGRLPDRNVSEVVERLPGVGVTYDQGEGRYVAIRGVPSALNNYTLNGVEVGNPDGTTRALPLDVVSGQLLNRVEVSKVKTADMDGQGIGGTINLVPQTAFDFQKAFTVAGSAKAGYQALNKKVPYAADLSIAGRFGPDEQFGVVLGGSYSYRDFDSNGFYPDNWRPDARFARGGVPDNIKYTEYSLVRERIGVTGSLDWRPSDKTSLYVRGFYSRFTEDEVRPRYRLDFATPAITGPSSQFASNFVLNPDGLTGVVTNPAADCDNNPTLPGQQPCTAPERREDLRLDYKAKYLATGMIGGSTDLGAIKLDYNAAYSRNETLDEFPIWQFRCNPGTVNFDFSEKVYGATPATECTSNQMQFRQYTEFHQLNVEKIWQGRFDATWDLADRGFVKAGVKFRNTNRSFDQENPTWVRANNPNRWTLGQFNLGAPGVCVFPDSGNTDECYFNAPVFDIPALQAFTEQNVGGALMPIDAGTTLANATLADFALKEQVWAGYVMANLEFGDAIAITPGLRFEHTKLDVTGFRLANGTTIVPTSVSNSYDDFLPSLVVRITPSKDTIFRLAWSRSLGRPEYASLSPGGSIDTLSNPIPSASFGNPDLKPYRADNFDATGEWYFARGGLLSVGVFAKFIRNPIFGKSTTVTDFVFNGVTYPVATVSQPFNAVRGDIIGIEAQYQQQFTFLPGLLSGFGIQLTATLTDSHLTLPDGRTSTFPNQSKYLYGAELFYQKGPIEASIAYHNTGHALLGIGSPAYNDQYNDDLRRLDAKISFELLDGVRLFAEAQNLTDEPTRQYQAGNPDWLIQNERYGRTFYAGVSARF